VLQQPRRTVTARAQQHEFAQTLPVALRQALPVQASIVTRLGAPPLLTVVTASQSMNKQQCDTCRLSCHDIRNTIQYNSAQEKGVEHTESEKAGECAVPAAAALATGAPAAV
jgi:hypothetical protein